MQNLMMSEVDFDAANAGLNKSKSGALNLGKLKLRSSQYDPDSGFDNQNF